MKVPAKIETKVALLKTLKESLKNDRLHAQIAKLQAKLKPQFDAITEIETELKTYGIEKVKDGSFQDRSADRLEIATITRNASGFKTAGFFKEIGGEINATLGSKNAIKAMDCINSVKAKNTTLSKTWKLKVC